MGMNAIFSKFHAKCQATRDVIRRESLNNIGTSSEDFLFKNGKSCNDLTIGGVVDHCHRMPRAGETNIEFCASLSLQRRLGILQPVHHFFVGIDNHAVETEALGPSER